MTKQAGGLRARHHGDVMELLAQARPARLDPGAAVPPPAEAAARLAAASDPQPPAVPAALRSRRMPRAAVLTGTGLTAAAAAVAVALFAASAGGAGLAGQNGHGGKGGTRAPALLTDAMVRQVASASRSALALSGRATISYRNSQAGKLQDSGIDRITYSGKNWNDALSQTFPAPAGQRAHTQSAIDRIVNGQFYLYVPGRTRRPQWYHDTNPSGHPGFTIPDPRTVLALLAPAARFEFAGYQVIDGIRVKHLRATHLSHLPSLGVLSEYSAGPHALSLDVWVDARSVVHRLSLTTSATHTEYPASAYNMRRTHDGRLIFTVPNRAIAAALKEKLKKSPPTQPMTVRIAPPGHAAPHHEVQVTALTVTFSEIGQPQRITAPAHAIQQFGRG